MAELSAADHHAGTGELLIISTTSPARGGGAPVLPGLQARHDVLDVSPLGHWHGPPFPPGAPVSLAAIAEGVAHDMDDAGLDRHLVGNSLGGWIALELPRGHLRSVVAAAPAAITAVRNELVIEATRTIGRPAATSRTLPHSLDVASRSS
ncbi:MAG TPA: hypothetical protein VGJ32_13125 [Solirubrobacteraceae bacterium]